LQNTRTVAAARDRSKAELPGRVYAAKISIPSVSYRCYIIESRARVAAFEQSLGRTMTWLDRIRRAGRRDHGSGWNCIAIPQRHYTV